MLRLYPPRKGLSQNWRIRGTHGFGPNRRRVDISARTHDRKKAEANLRSVADEIDAGTWDAAPREDDTFASAAMSYMQTSGNARYVPALIRHFGETPWREIDQSAIDRAAVALRPSAGAATRNRTVYTPLAAILRHKGSTLRIRRPPGAKGKPRTDYLNPPDAMAIIEAAETFDARFSLMLRFLLYSGARLGEVLSLDWSDLQNGTAYIRQSKNDDPRTVRLRDDLADDLEPLREAAGPVFSFSYGGHLKELLKRATCLASGVTPASRGKSPAHRLRWVNFHTFRHTFATWFRRAGGDVQGLVATGNWRDPKSASRYSHVHAHEEWERTERFPSMKRG